MDISKFTIGRPVRIKTDDDIYDSYISAITLTDENFVYFKSGSLRITLLDKLKSENNENGNKLDVAGGTILGNLTVNKSIYFKDSLGNKTNLNDMLKKTAEPNRHWHLESGRYHYEGEDINEYNLPNPFCQIEVIMTERKERGIAIAIQWQEGVDNYRMWINKLHDDYGNCNWFGWVEVPLYKERLLIEGEFTENTDKYSGYFKYVIDRKICYLVVSSKCVNASSTWTRVANVPPPLFDPYVDFPVGTQVDTANMRASINSEGFLNLHGGGQSGVDYTAFIAYPIA